MDNQQKENDTKQAYRVEFLLKNRWQLIVRAPEVKDAQAIINQMKTVDHESKFLAREPGEFNFTVEQEEHFIDSNNKDENTQFLIGEINGEIVGNCSVGLLQSKKRYLHRAATGIAISKEYWNLGIGKIMMQECIKWCKVKGLEQLELEVVCENQRAIAMYTKLGFEICGTMKHSLKYADGTYADQYNMILFL